MHAYLSNFKSILTPARVHGRVYTLIYIAGIQNITSDIFSNMSFTNLVQVWQ